MQKSRVSPACWIISLAVRQPHQYQLFTQEVIGENKREPVEECKVFSFSQSSQLWPLVNLCFLARRADLLGDLLEDQQSHLLGDQQSELLGDLLEDQQADLLGDQQADLLEDQKSDLLGLILQCQ